MALQPCVPFVYSAGWPIERVNAIGSAQNQTLDADTEYVVFHFVAPRTETITRAEVVISSVATAGGLTASIVTIAADGSPNTVVGSIASLSVSASGAYEVTGLNASLTAGTLYGLRVMVTSGTNLALAVNYGGSEFGGTGDAIHVTNTSGSVVRAPSSGRGVPVGLGTAAGYVPIHPGWIGAVTFATTINIPSSANFVGNRLVMPFRCRVGGVHVVAAHGTTQDWTGLIANAAGTVLASRAVLGAQSGVNGQWGVAMFPGIEVAAGDVIYPLVRIDNAVNLSVGYANFRANASLAAMWGIGSYQVDGTTLGTWTERTARIAGVFPVVTALDDGVSAGGGGLAANPIRGFIR